MATIANMTLDELTELINQIVDRRLEYLLGTFDIDNEEGEDQRTLDEIFASIDRNLWIPPADAPSTTDLLRQDRDS